MDETIKQQFKGDVDLLSSIIGSIETNNALAFRYTKDIGFEGVRKVHPHNLYWNKDNTKVLLDAVQVSGDSKSGIKSFKQFDTKYIKNCIILDEKFTIDRAYNSKSDRYNNSILGIIE
jgi:hypothetical protein